MIHSKSSSGFGIIEAMLAIAIVGFTVTPMLILQTEVVTAVTNLTQRFHRLIFAKNFFFKAEQKEPSQSVNYSTEEKQEEPVTMVRYTLRSIAEQSSLHRVPQLYKQEVQATGISNDAPSSTVVQFVYKPKEIS